MHITILYNFTIEKKYAEIARALKNQTFSGY